MSAPPDISLPRFEGPLDLLLDLVRKHRLDIADIPIAVITRQYLDYLRKAEALHVELGSEFIHMAALLIHIKSRCLLARDPAAGAGGEDPRQELARLLMDRQEVRSGADFLKQRLEIAASAWSRSVRHEFEVSMPACETPDSSGALNVLQILRVAQQALAVARTHAVAIPSDPVSVEQMANWLKDRLAGERRFEAGGLLSEQPDKYHRAALFLAMLELANSGRIRLEQDQCFGPIWLGATVP